MSTSCKHPVLHSRLKCVLEFSRVLMAEDTVFAQLAAEVDLKKPKDLTLSILPIQCDLFAKYGDYIEEEKKRFESDVEKWAEERKENANAKEI